jgi:hypothetical protein
VQAISPDLYLQHATLVGASLPIGMGILIFDTVEQLLVFHQPEITKKEILSNQEINILKCIYNIYAFKCQT